METTMTNDVVAVVQDCTSALKGIEAALIEQCHLAEPKMPFKTFASTHGLTPKELADLRKRAMDQMKSALADRNIFAVADVL